MTDNMTSQNIDLSSWDILYRGKSFQLKHTVQLVMSYCLHNVHKGICMITLKPARKEVMLQRILVLYAEFTLDHN
jgi:hypothetical protein